MTESSRRFAKRTNAKQIIHVRKQRLLGRRIQSRKILVAEPYPQLGMQGQKLDDVPVEIGTTTTSRSWSMSSRNRDFARSMPPVTGEKSSSILAIRGILPVRSHRWAAPSSNSYSTIPSSSSLSRVKTSPIVEPPCSFARSDASLPCRQGQGYNCDKTTRSNNPSPTPL